MQRVDKAKVCGYAHNPRTAEPLAGALDFVTPPFFLSLVVFWRTRRSDIELDPDGKSESRLKWGVVGFVPT